MPEVNVADWRLGIIGLVERPVTRSFDDISKLPRQTLQAFHEYAGDPRQPRVATRRISNVVWGGVPLSRVLSKYAVAIRPQASYLWAGGLDRRVYRETPVGSYVKDLPLDEVLAHAFLAYELNGAPLMPEHGYPLRLGMPGYYGTNSVKWVCRLELADARSESLFTTPGLARRAGIGDRGACAERHDKRCGRNLGMGLGTC